MDGNLGRLYSKVRVREEAVKLAAVASMIDNSKRRKAGADDTKRKSFEREVLSAVKCLQIHVVGFCRL